MAKPRTQYRQGSFVEVPAFLRTTLEKQQLPCGHWANVPSRENLGFCPVCQDWFLVVADAGEVEEEKGSAI